MLKLYIIFILLASFCVIRIQGYVNQQRDYGERPDASFNRVKRQAEINPDLDLPKEEIIDICDNSTLDAIFSLRDGTSYIFRGSTVWKVVNDEIQEGFPADISDTFPGLEDDVDAAFTYDNDEVVIFKGSHCWKFKDNKMEDGYPKYIRDVFPGIPDNIQATTLWGTEGYIYFFKGDQYWRYEPKNRPQVQPAYPKIISEVWRGIPNNLDDALLYSNGITYFFKGIRYWRLDDENLEEYVEKTHRVPYPRLIAPWWLSCRPVP